MERRDRSGQSPSRRIRRQLSLLVPNRNARSWTGSGNASTRCNMLIPAHVTLCREHERPGPTELAERLHRLGAFSFTMAFGAPEVRADGCVLLRAAAGVDEYDALRRTLLGPGACEHGAHLTLLHPRNANGVLHDLADIARETDGWSAGFDAVTLIEQPGDDPWRILGAYPTAR